MTSNSELAVGWTNGIGVYNLTGGTVSVSANGNTSSVGGNLIASDYYSTGATGVLSIGGTGRLEVTNSGLNVGTNSNGNHGIVNLGSVGTGGGTLSTQFVHGADVGAGDTGISFVNFHGGTLEARQDNTNFLTATHVYVYGEGAKFDTAGQNVTISANLEVPIGSGVMSIPIVSGGAGYIGAPAVEVTGGNGDATAKATLDSSGRLTGIIITNPGTGYDVSPPVVTLVGGGAATSAAVLGTPTLAANVSAGGLTKLGDGTLTLTGSIAYAGPTVISAGTLSIDNGLTNTLSTITGDDGSLTVALPAQRRH